MTTKTESILIRLEPRHAAWLAGQSEQKGVRRQDIIRTLIDKAAARKGQ